MPQISIIVPVFNTSNQLPMCIESIVNQSYVDFELLLVDDGSTDNSGDICDEYCKKDARIKVFHNNNHGVSFSRNFGIDNAVGKYICFIDSDDTVEPMCLEELLYGINMGVELSVCGLNDCHYNGVVYSSQRNYDDFKLDFYNSNTSNIFASLIDDDRFSYCVAKLFVTDILRKNNIRFDEAVSKSEDTIFVFDYIRVINSCFIIGEGYYNYLHRPQGTSLSTVIDEHLYEKAKFADLYITKVLMEMNIYDENVEKAALKRQIIGSQNIINAYLTNKDISICTKIHLIDRILRDPQIGAIKEHYAKKRANMKEFYVLKYNSALWLTVSYRINRIGRIIKNYFLYKVQKLTGDNR